MTRRYTRETPEALYLTTYWDAVSARMRGKWLRSRHLDGTTSAGRWWSVLVDAEDHDAGTAANLPLRIARGDVTPVPVDLKREAAKFARAKKR